MDVNFCESGSPASNRNFIANVQLMVRGQFWWAVLWKYHGNEWPNKRCVGGKRKQWHNDNNSDLYSQQTWEHFAATREKLVHLSSGTPADLQKTKTKSTAIKWPPKTVAYTHYKSLFSATPAKEHTHTSTKPLQPLPSPAAMRAGNDAFSNPPHPPSIPSTAYLCHPSPAAWPTSHIRPTTSCLQTRVNIIGRHTTFYGHM